jgi:predicted nucleic acid-binding protein
VSYLVDTNVVAELSRRVPNPRVVSWFRDVPDTALHLSVLTVGELRKGVESVTDARRKERLRVWLENDLAEWFGDRLLPVTRAVADRWGRLLAEAGRPVPAVDSLLAATALHHGLRMVTRNSQDFALPGLDVVNPWDHGTRASAHRA